ncbi:MAG TPA: hypothetical protein VLQ93_04420, partial [Myxococcaceae bacterium]|nr:hypothetical protein [Myxococcaceae bacterium]
GFSTSAIISGFGMLRSGTDLMSSGNTVASHTIGSGSADDYVSICRGTNLTAELQAFDDTGHLMSEAARRTYFDTGSETAAYQSSERLHGEWVFLWGGERHYAEAHGAFGQELPQAFGMDRTLISVTTDPTVARRFAGVGGKIFVGRIPRAQLIPQTLSGSTESEYLLRHGTNAFEVAR